MSLIVKWFPVWGRASLYFLISLGTVIVEKIADILFNDKWPSAARWFGAMLCGTVAGLISLRAYFDTSQSRISTEIKAANTSNDGTVLADKQS